MRCIPHLPALLAFVCVLRAGVAGEIIQDERLGIKFVLPDGFISASLLEKGNVEHAYMLPAADGRKLPIIVMFTRLNGVMGREKLDPSKAPRINPGASLQTEKWKAFEVEAFRVPEQIGDQRTLTFNVQVPIAPQAVQIAVTGEESAEPELRSHLQFILANLEGKTNWLIDGERGDRLSMGFLKLGLCLGVLLLIVRFFRKARRLSRVQQARDLEKKTGEGGSGNVAS